MMKYYFPELGMVADDAYVPMGQDCTPYGGDGMEDA
jgi:hypothetical protein